MALNLHMGTVIVAALRACAMPAYAYDPDTMGDGLQSSIARGGRLYDNWYAEIKERVPAVSHPAYPRDRAHFEDPKTNWRCKECHGWDYRGRDGT